MSAKHFARNSRNVCHLSELHNKLLWILDLVTFEGVLSLKRRSNEYVQIAYTTAAEKPSVAAKKPSVAAKKPSVAAKKPIV